MLRHQNRGSTNAGQAHPLSFRSNIRMGRGRECDLSDSEHGMVVGARVSGLSVSETADPLRF